MFPPHIGDFTYVTDRTYTTLEICQMEVKILQALDFGLSLPLPPHFLRRISSVFGGNAGKMRYCKQYLEKSILYCGRLLGWFKTLEYCNSWQLSLVETCPLCVCLLVVT